MSPSFPSPEFDDAVAAACHGSATEADLRALNELLRRDSSARDEYLFRLELHARLASEPDLFSENTESARASATPLPAPAGRPMASIAKPLTPDFRRRGVRPLAWAAGLVLAAVGIWVLGWKWTTAGRPATSTAVAMLTRTVDAQWAEGKQRPRVGSALKPGWLRLRSGLAQVVFYSGARVVLEGPAELRLVSANEAACPRGRLLAEVPEPARGFRLSTDQLKLVDLGTSFGIDATSRQTEVHVFKGKVELRPGTRATQPLTEQQAAVVRENAAPRLMEASATAFSSMFEFQQRSLASEAFRYERWQFANAQLNEDPSLVVHLDFENLSGTDWTLRNAAARNRSVPNATVVGCVRGEGRWREKQALELQTVNDRVRLAVPGDFDALTLSAWVCIKGLDRQFNSLFMCDGFEPGTIHWLIRDDGVLGLTVIGPRAGKFQILASSPVPRLEEFGMWLHLAVVLDGRNRQVIHYVDGEPVSRHALRIEPPFRIGPAELGNWNAQSGSDPTPFLIRNLSGSFDEFALFGRALSDGQVRELHAQGKPYP